MRFAILYGFAEEVTAHCYAEREQDYHRANDVYLVVVHGGVRELITALLDKAVYYVYGEQYARVYGGADDEIPRKFHRKQG